MKRSIKIAKKLMAQSEVSGIRHLRDTEEGYIYSVKPKRGNSFQVLIRPGGTVAIKKKNQDEFETIDLDVPYDIVLLQDSNMSDFHQSLSGWLGDSRKFKEEI